MSHNGLTLEELQDYDATPVTTGAERDRYLCPLCADSKPQDDPHRSLSVARDTGFWTCHRCGEHGLLKDFREFATRDPFEGWEGRRPALRTGGMRPASTPAPTAARPSSYRTDPAPAAHGVYLDVPAPGQDPRTRGSSEALTSALPISRLATTDALWRRMWENAVPVISTHGKPGMAYLESRGIHRGAADRGAVRYSSCWYRRDDGTWREAVVFPSVDAFGTIVGAQGRQLGAEGGKPWGTGSVVGVFAAVPEALIADPVILVEGPMDVLTLALQDYPALATFGCNLPAWLPELVAGRRVIIATDADEAGDRAAREWARKLMGRAKSLERLRSDGAKDWNAALMWDRKALAEQLRAALGAPWYDCTEGLVAPGR